MEKLSYYHYFHELSMVAVVICCHFYFLNGIYGIYPVVDYTFIFCRIVIKKQICSDVTFKVIGVHQSLTHLKGISRNKQNNMKHWYLLELITRTNYAVCTFCVFRTPSASVSVSDHNQRTDIIITVHWTYERIHTSIGV